MFTFASHLATLVLAINEFNRSSQCSLSLSILAIILALISLLPFICASALLVKDSLVHGVSGLNGALASTAFNHGDIHAFMNCVADERCPGHLDGVEGREARTEGSLLNGLNGLPQESVASYQAPSGGLKGNGTRRGDASPHPNPPDLVRARRARLDGMMSVNQSSVIPLTSNNRLISPRVPASGHPVDLDLSVIGQYLARHYGMFAWRIHPLIHAHNAFADLDASFRRLDMFMHSARAGMLYHELIIFVDYTAIPHASPGYSLLQAKWQMYAARTRACDLLDPSHACFRPVDGDQCNGAEVWQNCLQWDAPIARVLNTAYMRRTKEASVQRWDVDAHEYWRRGEGLSKATVDRVGKAILAYGVVFPLEEFPTELAFEGVVSSSPKVHRAIQVNPEATYESETEDSFSEGESGCAVGLSSCEPDCECPRDIDAGTQGVEVGDTPNKSDFWKELRRDDEDVEHGSRFDGGFDCQTDFGFLDSVLSDATPPPASLTPSSSEASSSSCDMDSECILYPRLVRSSTPISRHRDSPFLGLGSPPRTCIHPATFEESPSFATSSSSERILADFSAVSLALSTRTSTGMNIQESGPSSSSSSPRAVPGLTLPAVDAHPYDPSLLDLALALGAPNPKERLRKRELTSSSSYPSPPRSSSPPSSPSLRSPSSQLLEDSCPHGVANSVVPIAKGQPEMWGTSSSQREYKYSPPPSPSPLSVSTACDADGILPNAPRASCTESAPTSEYSSADPASEIARDSLRTCMDADAAIQSPPSLRKLRVRLNVTFRKPPSCSPSASPIPADSTAPRVRTAFSLWEAIMRPQAAHAQQSTPPLASADIPRSDSNPNSPTSADCDRTMSCGHTPCPPDGSLSGCFPRAGVHVYFPDTSDGEWEMVRLGKKTRRGGEKARRQRERRRARIETAEAWDAEWSVLAGICSRELGEMPESQGLQVRERRGKFNPIL